jgi:hypothetical protein
MKITIDQYMSIIDIIQTFKDNDEMVTQEFVKLFHGDTTLPIANAKKLLNEVQDIILEDTSEFVQRFKYDGVEYGFIPNLDDISTGEYIDLDNLMKNENQNIHRIMSVLYRPITKKMGNLYEIEEYQGSRKYSEVMKNVDHKIYKGAMVFFYLLSIELLANSNIFLNQSNQTLTKTN